MTYSIVLLDKRGYELSSYEADTLKDAKRRAKNILTPQWANTNETTHTDMGSHKVEVRNDSGECVYDLFI